MPSKRAILAVLLLLSVAVAPVAAQTAAETTRSADLVVRQESYVTGDVSVQAQNGTRVYSVRGERVWIRPQNFDPSSVVDFGVSRGAGELAFDDGMGAYTFSSGGEQASFGLYWVALEEVSTGNNTTTVRRVRYEATVRVVGQANLEHAPKGELEQLRSDAENWERFNSTVQDVREMDLLLWTLARGGDPPSTEAVLQGMVSTYVTTRDPFRLLTGGFFEVIVILTLSLGGILYLVIREGLATLVVRRLTKRLNVYRGIEAEEGEIAQRQLELDRAESERAFANLDINDLPISDHEAEAYRQALGDTVREAFERMATDILVPSVIINERLQAMAQCGYVARVLERDDDGEVIEAEIVQEGNVDENELVERLDEPGGDLVDALWNDPTMLQSFDPTRAEFDLAEFADPPKTFSLDEAIDALRLQREKFEDETALGKLVREHIEWAAQSDYTDEHGTPRSSQRVLNSFLSTCQWLSDTHGIPSARLLGEHIERALLDYDPGREAEEYARDVEEGKYV